MTANRTSVPATVPAGLARHKQMLLVALAGVIAAVGVLVLFWLGSDSVSAQGVDITFSPSVSITVPQTDANDDGVNDYSGTSLIVEFERYEDSSSPGLTSNPGLNCNDYSASGTYVVQGNGSVVETSAAVLLGHPEGMSASCVFEEDWYVNWPSVGGWNLQPGATEVIQASSRSASAVYVLATTYFRPSLRISFPWVDADADGDNDFDDTSFAVEFRRVEGSHADCTASASHSATVRGRSILRYSASLVAYPSDVRTPCVYAVSWPEVPGWVLQPGAAASVSATAKSASATYTAVPVSYFTPDVVATITQVDSNGDGVHDFSGASLRVLFKRVSFSNGLCAPVYGTYVVRNDGSVVETIGAVLLDRYEGAPRSCEYFVATAAYGGDWLDGLRLEWTSRQRNVSASSGSVVINFATHETTFAVDISVTAPQLDVNGDGVNDFSGAEYSVRLRPVSGSNSRCPSYDQFISFTIGDDGMGVPKSVGAIDHPVGAATSCVYDVVGWGRRYRDLRWSLQPGYTRTLSSSSNVLSAVYVASPAEYFTPDVTIRIPNVDTDEDGVNDYSGTSLKVEFNGRASYHRSQSKREQYGGYFPGCPDTFGTYVVQNSGRVVPSSVPRLLDLHEGVGESCNYWVGWPLIGGLERIQEWGVSSAKSAEADYVAATSWFQTWSWYNIDIDFPRLDADGDGANDFSGTSFVVELRRAEGSPAGCTASLSHTFTIDDNGNLRRFGPNARLEGYLEGVLEACVYDVIWPELAALVQAPGATTTVSYLERSISASYVPFASSSFTPQDRIIVQWKDHNKDRVSDLSGTSLVMTFKPVLGSNEGCTNTTTGTYIVQDNGQGVTSFPNLVDRPEGVVVGCSYAITWPTMTGLVLQPGATTTVSASARSIFAEYHLTAETQFTPDVSITVPQLDENGDGVNDFSDTFLSFRFEPVPGSHAGCSTSVHASFYVQNNGMVTNPGWSLSLVDRPAGETSNCSYKVAWGSATGLALQPGATVTVSAASRSASASYRVHIASYFTPNVTISVPQLDADGNGVNDFAGTGFRVMFEPVLGSDTGCMASDSGHYVVRDSGSVTGSGSDPSLVDRPAGVTVGCSYAVLWPRKVNLVRQPGATISVNASAKIATASYRVAAETSFSPNVFLSVPYLDADGDSVNDFAGTSFMVTFRRVFGSNVGCTASATGTYVAQYNGPVMGTNPILVDRPAGVAVRCSYAVTWPTAAGWIRQPGATTSVNASAEIAKARYRATAASSFSPDVAITVPQLDADRDGANDFAGTSFVVTFRRVFGSNSGCTAAASRTYVVQPSGTVAGSDPSLVDRPAGAATGCSYAITWPNAAGLEVQPNATISVSASSRAASASYRATSATSFSPDVNITVPQLDADRDGANDFAGTSFVVTFRRVFGSNSGCTSSISGSYVVQNNGSVAGSDPSLGDRPAGVTSGCVYAISWPAVADLVRQSGATAWVRSTSKEASAVYETSPSYVAPEPAVEDPAVVEPEVEEEPAVVEPEPEPDDTQTQSPAASAGSGGGSSPASGGGAGAGSGAGSGSSGGGSNTGAGSGAGSGNSGSGSGSSGVGSNTGVDAAPLAPVPEVGVIELSQGWVMLPFNGPSGMTPADFAEALENTINSVWVWDMATQQWKGWTASRGSISLASLTPGDVVMVYAPTGGVVVYSPADLLGHRVGVNSWTLAPTGISLVVYGGGSATSASDVFASYANSAVVVYLWDSQNQRWEYHLPGRQPLDAVQVPWFSDINPGDAMFVYNISPTAVTIPWQ